MNIPITARVKGMGKKSCGCAKKCGCGSPAKKPLVGNQNELPQHLQKAILAS